MPSYIAVAWGVVWARGAPLLLLAAALLAVSLAYQRPMHGRLSLAAMPSPVVVGGAYPPERAGDGTLQRWTTPAARIRLAGVGRAAYTFRLRFFGGAAEGAGRLLRVGASGLPLGEVRLHPFWQQIELNLPAAAIDGRGDVAIELNVTPLRVAGDERALGVSLAWLELVPRAGPRTPPLERGGEVACIALLVFWALRLIGLGSRAALVAAGALLFSLLVATAIPEGGLASPRLQAILALIPLGRVLPLAVALAALLRLATRAWDVPPPAELNGRNLRLKACLSDPPRWAVLLRLAVLLIFVLRLVGLHHPQFIAIDHGLRANQLLQLAAGRPDLVLPGLEQQYEWGTRAPVPYSLLSYYLLLPLVWLTSDHGQLVAAIKLVTVLLDASVPLLFWLLLRHERGGNMVAAWAGLCYAALPVGYLFFHDGSFPTTIGLWIVILALALFVSQSQAFARPQSLAQRLLRYLLCIASLTLALAAYVTHIAFVTFLVGALAASLYYFGAAEQRQAGRRLFGLLAGALLLAWLLVYRDYSLALITHTIPAYLGIIASEGSVGRDPERFFGTPINSFPQHLYAHLRIWPALLGAVALARLGDTARRSWAFHLGLAYALFIITSSLAETVFGLWNKHFYFAAPGIALLAGVALVIFWRHGLAGRIFCLALLAALFWASTFAWGNRVLWYALPPDAL